MKFRYLLPYSLFDIGILLMLTGLLHSRILLSMGMMVLFIHSIIAHPIGQTWKSFVQQPVLWSTTSLFFLYFLTGLYSSDMPEFWMRIRIALPLLFLPFCFAKDHWRSRRQKLHWLYYFLLLVSKCLDKNKFNFQVRQNEYRFSR